MYIIVLTYIKPVDEIDKYLDQHQKYLEKYYHDNKFIVSGRRKPRIGGVIVCHKMDKEELKQIILEDPFHIHQIATYDIIEFEPTRHAHGFEQFM